MRTVEDEVNSYRDSNNMGGNVDDTDNLLNVRITEQEVLNSLMRLKSGKAAGPDGLPSDIYKHSAIVILPLLVEIFNFIFDSGSFPSEWSGAIIIPIFKKGAKNDVNNYRYSYRNIAVVLHPF